MRTLRKEHGIEATFKTVDTCAAEFEAETPYYYSTYGMEDEVRPSEKRKILILGSGPNRIGQGIEFDYCCVHAALALKEDNYETIMVNSNPETVSTDYDTSDRLYFEPLTHENVLNIVDREKPDGVIVQLGGQTPSESRAWTPEGGRSDYRDKPRGHCKIGGSEAVYRVARRARLNAAPKWHGNFDRRKPHQSPRHWDTRLWCVLRTFWGDEQCGLSMTKMIWKHIWIRRSQLPPNILY